MLCLTYRGSQRPPRPLRKPISGSFPGSSCWTSILHSFEVWDIEQNCIPGQRSCVILLIPLFSSSDIPPPLPTKTKAKQIIERLLGRESLQSYDRKKWPCPLKIPASSNSAIRCLDTQSHIAAWHELLFSAGFLRVIHAVMLSDIVSLNFFPITWCSAMPYCRRYLPLLLSVHHTFLRLQDHVIAWCSTWLKTKGVHWRYSLSFDLIIALWVPIRMLSANKLNLMSIIA